MDSRVRGNDVPPEWNSACAGMTSRVRLAFAFASIVAVAACMSPPLTPMSRLAPVTPAPREVTALMDGATITLKRKQELIVALDANPTTGYRWTAKQNVAGLLEAVGEPSFAARPGDSRLVGAGGVTTFRFRAVDAGSTALVLTYRRPWEANLPPAKTLRYEITVE